VSNLQSIAAAAGTTVLELVEDYGNLAYSLAETTLVGQIAAQAGIAGGQALVDDAASLLADTSEFLGVDIAQLDLPATPDTYDAVPVPETGALPTTLAKARTYLGKAAPRVAQRIAASGTAIVKGLVAIGLTYAAYGWLTEDLQVRLAEIESRRSATVQAIAKLPAEQLGPIAQQLAQAPGVAIPWWGWALGLGAAGLVFWRWLR
jgi:hypothetical protein